MQDYSNVGITNMLERPGPVTGHRSLGGRTDVGTERVRESRTTGTLLRSGVMREG